MRIFPSFSGRSFFGKTLVLLVALPLFGGTWLNGGSAFARQSQEQLDVHAQRVMIRGLTWLQNGYPDRAAAVYAEGLKVHPDNAALLASMASAQQAMGELGTARFYLDQALERAPGQSALASQDLDLALASGNRAAALKAMERIIALDDMSPHYLLRHLTVLLEKGPVDLSPDLASQGLALFPDDVNIVEATLRVFRERGQTEAAIRSARRLVELRGGFDDTLLLSTLLMQDGRWDEAADFLTPLVSDEPDDADLMAMLADLNARLPERDLAAESGMALPEADVVAESVSPSDSLAFYRSAWEAVPEDEERVVQLTEYLMRNGKAREAALLAEEHVESYPRHLSVWTLTIEAWLEADEPETALSRSEDAVLLFPGFPPIVLERAKALAATGNHAAAAQAIDELLERLDADSEEAATARSLRQQFQQPQ